MTSNMLRIVLDSNILVGAFLTPKGESWEILRQAKNHKLYLSLFILSEVEHTLQRDRIRRKYSFTDDELHTYIIDLVMKSALLDPQLSLTVCQDPDDNAILACAVEAEADYLVTRNTKHFPRTYKGVVVIQPKEFLKVLKQS